MSKKQHKNEMDRDSLKVTAVHEAAHVIFFIIPCEDYYWGEGLFDMRPVGISIIPSSSSEGYTRSNRNLEVLNNSISPRRRVWHILGLMSGYASEIAFGLTSEDKADADFLQEVNQGMGDFNELESDFKKCLYVIGDIVDYLDVYRDEKCFDGLNELWKRTKELIIDSPVIKKAITYVEESLMKQPTMDKAQVYTLVENTFKHMNDFEGFKLKVPLLKNEQRTMTLID
ncbi:hypothetical protein [Fibrivirga algicola]|uniref:Peptidase M41 domain-containing protein n=1 Tax=Fibrivirga algicola TaxID=2950420 RepID=A0ABX0QDX7_9BACT|nr:hypothetical protein [Fibrivirga algicola]NID10631.1 hypothetical protein [Fibrivirga algicola]